MSNSVTYIVDSDWKHTVCVIAMVLTRALAWWTACMEISLQMGKTFKYIYSMKTILLRLMKIAVFNLPGTNIWAQVEAYRSPRAFWTWIPIPAQPSQTMLTCCIH